MDSAEPLSSILWTLTPHPGDPLRRGILAAAVDRDIGSRIPVQVAHPHFDVVFGCFVFGLRSFAFQKITLGWYLSFFIIGWKKRRCSGSFVVSFLDYR